MIGILRARLIDRNYRTFSDSSSWPGLRLAWAVLLLSIPETAQAEGIRWRQDYASALKEASQKGAPLFVNVGTTDCFWCKQLDVKTFVEEEIVRLLNERCIPLKIDASSPSNEYLVQALRIRSYPTLIFASHDSKILGYREGFLDAEALKEQITKVLAAVGTPDWMQRDFEAASAALSRSEYPKAIGLLRSVLEDGKERPVQIKARKLLEQLEKQASERAHKVRELVDKGDTQEALAQLDQLEKVYPGTLAARRGSQWKAELVSRSRVVLDARKRQASDLLRQAQEDYKNSRYLCTLDRCEEIALRFSDLDEAREADLLVAEIKNNPEWTKKAADQLAERLCALYLSLADTWLKKGQPQQAIFYLERILKLFPGTRQAELAQVRLTRLRGTPLPEKK